MSTGRTNLDRSQTTDSRRLTATIPVAHLPCDVTANLNTEVLIVTHSVITRPVVWFEFQS